MTMSDEEIIRHYGGTVSHGTMRAVDLLDVLPDVIGTIDAFRREGLEAEYGDWFALHRCITNGFAEPTDKGLEELDRLVRECFTELDDMAPDGYYFGAHEGDGSDYGFWKNDDDDDDDECEGHEATTAGQYNGPIGETVYCDGSCRGK